LKYELSKLVALVTVYGEQMVLDACSECLKSGIVGIDNLELFLKRQHHPSNTILNPAPIQFESEKLNRVHPAVDLRKYDALYFEGENHQSVSREGENGNYQQGPARGTDGAQAQVLGSGDIGGSGEDEGSGKGGHIQIPDPVDREGEIGAPHFHDPEQDQNCEVPPGPDGGKL
jgi:hypothetical protein